MTIEKQLINKTYYEKFMDEANGLHPIQVLGNAYMDMQQEEISDLSYIRYAQGEVYFLNRDYEAAIFKWENISNELEPWAKKNIADAYFELNLLSTAEEIYKTVSSENLDLMTEVSLQLFSIYIEQGKLDAAVREIKGTVSLNPDYPNVTDIAKSFFLEQKDWGNAVELAVNEAIRTESVLWFDTLKSYIDQGVTKMLPADYFDQALLKLYSIDQIRFEKLVVSIWNSFKEDGKYFSWIQGFDQLFLPLETNHYDSWEQLSAVYKDTYFHLIGDGYFIREIRGIMPDLLSNWLKISTGSNSALASAAIISWSELFDSSISSAAVQEAERTLTDSNERLDTIDSTWELFKEITNWADKHGLNAGYRLNWLIQELSDMKVKHVMTAGATGSGQPAFVNSLIGEGLLETPSSSVIVLKNQDETEMNEITDTVINQISSMEDFDMVTSFRGNTSESRVVECKISSSFLNENNAALVNIPAFNENRNHRFELFEYLPLADSLLFILNAQSPFTDDERELLLEIRERAPYLPVLFVLNNHNGMDEQELSLVLEEARTRIGVFFPNAKAAVYSPSRENRLQLEAVSSFIQSSQHVRYAVQERASKLLYFVRKVIKELLETRVEMEKQLEESIEWNKEMVLKLNGAVHQIGDMEKEKTYVIKNSFHNIMEDIKKELKEEIPQILRKTSEFIKEDSDFRKIHLELNEEMNVRVHHYLQEQVLPKLYQSIQDWIGTSNSEFSQSQTYIDEMSESFNSLYGEERINLECDFRVLDDWRRDADRMTSSVHLEKVNIFLRHTPSQILLKSAGKLFGGLGQNKAMLYTRYQRFVESDDYNEATESISSKFLQQFELFEQTLARDISLFFRQPLNALNQHERQTKNDIKKDEDSLEKLKTNPETYRDPLSLYDLRARQYEWIAEMGKSIEYVQ